MAVGYPGIMPQFVLKDSVPDLENAERLAPFYKERAAWVRNQIHVSLETILMANGTSREEARANPLIQKAYEACDAIDQDIRSLEESIQIVRAWIAEHPELLAEKPWPHIWGKCGNLINYPKSIERHLNEVIKALQ
jgi:hypothetical protein